MKKLGELGLLGVIFPPEYGGAGLGYVDYVLAIEELSAVDGSIGHHRCRAQLAGDQPYLSCRLRSAEAEICSAARQRRVAGCVGTHRARLRLRCQQRAHHRGQERRPLHSERQQDLHHQRPLCRRRGGHRRDRQEQGHARTVGLHRGERNQGIPARQEGKQAGPARQRHQRTDLRGLRDSRGKSARRRRRGIHRRHARARRRQNLDCGAGAGHRAAARWTRR